MSSDLPRSKRFRADSALALASGIALPSRVSAAVPTLTYTNSNSNTNSEGQDQLGLFHDDQWQDVFIPVSVGQAPLTSADVNPVASRKRPWSSPLGETADAEWLRTNFPELGPDILQLPSQATAPVIVNPFLSLEPIRHPRLRHYSVPVAIPEDGYIDGLIKVRLNLSRYQQKFHATPRLQKFPWKGPKHGVSLTDQDLGDTLARLPPDFGRGLKLAGMDEKLFEFYRIAICGAVTLIKADNCYLQEVIPIAVKSDCVKHAILAQAATYILDYSGEEKVKTEANVHWKRAVHLLNRELQATERCKPGKENAIVAAMVLFGHNENVNWEATDSGNDCPPWYKATDLAERVLETSDPLHNYHSPGYVQCSRARIMLGNRIALYNIMSEIACPLDEYQVKCSFNWLLEGSERELHRIVGCTGLCPKLMHTFAQITHLSAKLYKDPNRLAARNLGRVIGERLENFEQHSDLSEGYPNRQALLDSCKPDENGEIFTAVKTVELLAESYVATAQIYLYCRLMRKSRRHPHVQQITDRALWIIERMATSGPLFNGAHAQVRVFVAAIVAVEQRHRDIVRTWFEELCHGTRGVSHLM
ncbi:hypothetical protein AA0112_g11598 [Alternaria arborescens]|nr:hypothetical protein AA0112_g11598 [Alternaria arborescens]